MRGSTLRFSITVFSVFLLNACVRTSNTGSPQINGAGFAGVIGADNARPRCRFQDRGDRNYDVFCQAVVIQPSGEEVLATSVASGVVVEWSAPKKIDGGEVEVGRCSVAADQLSQQCAVSLSSPAPAKVQFEIVTTEIASGKQNKEAEIVHLPFSVEPIGKVAQLLTYETEIRANEKTFGLQNSLMTAAETSLGSPLALCSLGGKLYFATESHIYVLEDGKVRLYAGSTNPANNAEYSHRLRVKLGRIGRIVCGTDGVYVLDMVVRPKRILRIPESGRIVEYSPNFRNDGKIAVRGEDVIYGEQNALYRIEPSGKSSPVSGPIISPPPLEGGDSNPASKGLTLGADGSLYAATESEIRRIDSKGVVSLFATASGIKEIAAGSSGEIYVLGAAGIRKVDKNGEISDFVSFAPSLSDFSAITVHRGEIFVAGSSSGNRVYRISSTKELEPITGAAMVAPLSTDASVAAADAVFGQISAIALDSSDGIYVSDVTQHQVFRVDPQGRVSVVAGTGTTGFSGDGGPSAQAVLNNPSDIVLASDNSLYIADGGNQRIRKVSRGEISSFAILPQSAGSKLKISLTANGRLVYFGAGNSNMGLITETGHSFPLNLSGDSPGSEVVAPGGVTLRSNGDLVYSDGITQLFSLRLEDGIRPHFGVMMNFGMRSHLAGQFPIRVGYSGDDGPAKNAQFYFVRGVASDEEGNVYVADSENGRIRRIFPNAAGTDYEVETFIGGATGKDCSGAIVRKNLSSANMENEIQVSLASVCFSKPVAFAIKKHCGPADENRRIVMAIAQSFGDKSNVLRIRRPCP